MKERAGRIFSIAAENQPVPGCTISRQVLFEDGYALSWFSLAAGTDISAESYTYPKLLLVSKGALTVFTGTGEQKELREGESIATWTDVPVGIKAETDSVYAELSLRKESNMNEVIKAGEVFALKDLVPYQEDRIVNMDVIADEKLKLVIMSFDQGTGLSEHAAPGEALIFALDGEAVIGYEGSKFRIHAGENFKFDKLGKHSIEADHRFKMALLLKLD